MGWKFKVASSLGQRFQLRLQRLLHSGGGGEGQGDYNYQTSDIWVDELPGSSVFYKDADGTVYHTYSDYGRGNEEVLSAYMLLNVSPKGRNETINSNLMDWVHRHDEYPARRRRLQKPPTAATIAARQRAKRRRKP